MGALKYKACSHASLFARSDIFNKFVNAGFDLKVDDLGQFTVENFFGLPLPKADDPEK